MQDGKSRSFCERSEQLCRALGDANFKEGEGDAYVSNRPDVRHLLLTPADTAIVIASDGLFDVISDQQAAACVAEVFRSSVRPVDGHPTIRSSNFSIL